MAKGKQVIEKVASGEYELDRVTGELVKVSKDKINDQEITPNFSSGGYEHSHQFLAARAASILNNDGKTAAADWLFYYYTPFLLANDWPDDNENDGGLYLGHFYHAIDGTNYNGGTEPTAMTRFNGWMSQASYNFNRSDSASDELGITQLGYAMHYFADMNAPHHVANKIARLTNHEEWEYRADQNKSQYAISHSSRYNLYGTNFASYAQASANNAYAQISNAMAVTPTGGPDYPKWDLAADNTYKYCQANMAAVLDAFFRSKGIQSLIAGEYLCL